jgi:hypothetical protein
MPNQVPLVKSSGRRDSQAVQLPQLSATARVDMNSFPLQLFTDKSIKIIHDFIFEIKQ